VHFKHKIFKVKMLIEEHSDDCWNLFNLIGTGDFIFGTCHRKVAKESLTGLTKNVKKKVNVLIKVEKYSYDADVDLVRV